MRENHKKNEQSRRDIINLPIAFSFYFVWKRQTAEQRKALVGKALGKSVCVYVVKCDPVNGLGKMIVRKCFLRELFGCDVKFDV